MQTPQKIAVVGSGLVGSLLAIYLRKAGHTVHVYDRSPDIRQIEFSGRSINLAMSNRGWKALDGVGVGDAVREIAIPMDKRAIHLVDKLNFQPYGNEGEAIYSISRGLLNRKMIDLAEAAGAEFFFEQKIWDDALIADFGLTGIQLPAIQASASMFGTTNLFDLLDHPIAITAMIGDSHAAAFGEGCFEKGTAKATLGTGCSLLMHVGDKPVASNNGMVSTVCWSTENQTSYALEGVIVSCGSTIEWLKNDVGLFTDSKETESMALSVPDNNGVYIVPAFSGMGSPHWQMNRRASIEGLTFSATKHHIVRAALESITYQIADVIVAMEKDANTDLVSLQVDGGIHGNRFVVQWL